MTNTELDRLSDRLINWLENNGFSDRYSIELFEDSLEIHDPSFYLIKKEADRSIDLLDLGISYDLAIAKLREFFGV